MLKKSMLTAALGCALACLTVPSRAEAGAITFIFDYSISPGGTLTGPSPTWGSVTISDSVIDPNRVDISLTLTPPASFGTLDQFYLNLDLQPDSPPVGNDPDFVAKTQGYLVPINSAPGTTTGTVGAVSYSDGSLAFGYTLNGFVFDLNVNPNSSSLTFTGSWALYNDNKDPIADTPINLDASMFYTPSVFTATGGQTIPMYAAYRAVSTVSTDKIEFRAFASTAVPVPEPGTLSLLGIGILAAGRRLRRRS